MNAIVTGITEEASAIYFTFKKRRYYIDKDLFLYKILRNFSDGRIRYIGIRQNSNGLLVKCAIIDGIHESIYRIMNKFYKQGKYKELIIFVLCLLSKAVYPPGIRVRMGRIGRRPVEITTGRW